MNTHQIYVLVQWSVEAVSEEKHNSTECLSDTTVFIKSENSRFKIMVKIYIEILLNQIILYTRSTDVKPYQNILEHFDQIWSSGDLGNGPIILEYLT